MGLKEAGLRGSLRNVSEATPAFYDVQITGTNDPITEGDTLDVNYQVQNTGDQDGIKDVFLEIDTVEEDRDSNISLSGGATATGTLQWVTQDGEAGTYNAVVLSPDDSDSVSVSVGSAIPDSVDLQVDAAAVSSVDPTWADQSGNGNDLSAIGTPTLNGSINGNDAVLLDGSNDGFELDPFSQSLPVELFVVARLDDLTNRADIIDLESSSGAVVLYYDGSDSINLFSGGVVDGPAADTNPHIFNVIWRSGTDELILDGTSEITSEAGNRSPGKVTVGINGSTDGNYFPGAVGEVWYSTTELTTSERDSITQDLADKWGITI